MGARVQDGPADGPQPLLDERSNGEPPGVPDIQELIRRLRVRDRSLDRLRFEYIQEDLLAVPEERPRLRILGRITLDRGRIHGLRWTLLAGHDSRWERTIWDGVRGSTVRGVGTDEPLLGPESCDEFAPSTTVVLTGSVLGGTLASPVVGAATGLYYMWELWSQRFANTEDLVVLGHGRIAGRSALVVLLDATNALGARSNGVFDSPICVWFDLETLLAVRVQGYADARRLRSGGFPVEAPEGAWRPEPLEDHWIPLRFVELHGQRPFGAGLFIGTGADFGVASSGSPFHPTKVTILDPARPAGAVLEREFSLALDYPLTVIEEVHGGHFVLGAEGDEPHTLHDLRFWTAIVDHGRRLGLEVPLELESLLEDTPTSALSVLLAADRILGRRTPPQELVRHLPRDVRADRKDEIDGWLARALRALDAEVVVLAPSEFCAEPRTGLFLSRAAQAPGADPQAGHALVFVEQPGEVRVLVPGVRAQVLDRTTFLEAHPGPVLQVRSSRSNRSHGHSERDP